MVRCVLCGAAILLLAGCCGPAEPRYEVIRVVDGDTIVIEDAGGIQTWVRLRRIDAPEMDEPGGPEAKAALEAAWLGRQVRVTPYARDRYGRTVADVALHRRPGRLRTPAVQ